MIDVSNNPDKYLDLDDFDENEIKKANDILEKLQILIEKYPELNVGLSKLAGTIKSTGCHAGGVLISSKILKNYFPMAKAAGSSAVLPVIQLEMTDLDFFSILKLDTLGLKTLCQIQDTISLIDNFDKEWLYSEDFSDPLVYEHLRKGNTVNVFQMAKPQATRMLRDFQVDNFESISAVSAGVRPGLSNPTEVYDGKSPVDVYVEIKKGLREKDNYGPKLDKILEETNGIIWFQEDCQLIGQEMAGYSLGAADLKIRKTIA